MGKFLIALLVVLALFAFTASPAPTLVQQPTPTVEPATATPQPTSTTIPPTSTSVPPTATAVSTASPAVRGVSVGDSTNIVEFRASSNQNFATVVLGQALTVGSQVRTGDRSQARLDFTEGTTIRVGQNTLLTLEQLTPQGGDALTRFQLGSGKLWIASSGGVIEIRTPPGIATVRGTFAIVEVLPNGDMVFLLLQGVGRFVQTGATPTDSCARTDPCRNLRNRMGLSIRDNQFAEYSVPLDALEDFCNNLLDSCKPLANALGINLTDIISTRNANESSK